jgi:hypothetical protein
MQHESIHAVLVPELDSVIISGMFLEVYTEVDAGLCPC